MTYKKNQLALSVIALAFSHSITLHAQTASIGINAAVKGDVTITTAEEEAKQALIKDDVFLGQRVNSKQLSSLQIMLKDQTIFTVGPECDLVIDKFVYDPNKNTNSMAATVSKGMFRFMSGNISKSGVDAVTINTPVSSMGIRGTMVEGLVGANAIEIAKQEGVLPSNITADPNGATIFALRGPGPNTSGINTKGEISVSSGTHTAIVTGSNQAVFVPSAGALPIQFTLSPQAFQSFSEGIRTTPTSQNDYSPFAVKGYLNTPATSTNSIGKVQADTIVAGAAIAGLIVAILNEDDQDDEPVSP